eukprot:TRINITY_DN8585_c0_g3_i1.p1 TRINITY_DN8585_c0_g3~~TRINITY_DN8585_c0_g3_i1.p1  ORF type:complete len:455 (+),score=68.68 TRINITY_DN8585_c0_g3_i1:26-1366(+)
MDFDDLLVKLVELLEGNEDVRTKVAEKCQYVLIDEYQDTNDLQARIARQLSSFHRNIMVVGDDAQSIYGFRGAAVTNILEFPNQYVGCQVTKLVQNYRSTQQVLNLANGITESMASSAAGFDKQLQASARDQNQLPTLVKSKWGERSTIRFVIEQIKSLNKGGLKLKDIAVLARSAFHCNRLEVELIADGLPFKKYGGGIRFLDRAHIKDVISQLRIIANPYDEICWLRTLTSFDNVGPKIAKRLIQTIVKRDPPSLQVDDAKATRYSDNINEFARALSDWRDLCDSKKPADVVQAIIDWYLPQMEVLYPSDHRERSRDFETIRTIAYEHESLEDLLATLVLDPQADQEQRESADPSEFLTLSTIHSAKGLEWEAVFLLSCEDLKFPSAKALTKPSEIEDERRVFYVAVTRAKEKLYLLQNSIDAGCRLLDDVDNQRRLVNVLFNG